MIDIKTPEEIEKMQEGGKILSDVLMTVLHKVKPGVSELEIDAMAEQLIRKRGGQPAFKRVHGYRHTICVSTNDVVVHGIPSEYRFKAGDVVGIDCGVYYKGFNTDMSETIRVRKQQTTRKTRKDKIDFFLNTGEKALQEAINVSVVGNRVGHISQTIQTVVERAGFSIVRSLIGHGVGKKLHEEPEVPGYLSSPIAKTPTLAAGMTIAIEVIYNMGNPDVVYANNDNWTIKTKDDSLSGVFERTIAVTKHGPLMLT